MDNIIGRLFQKFETIYGEKFKRMWENTDPEMMGATWSNALKDYTPEQLGQAIKLLEQENPFPPALPEFIALCKRAKGSGQAMYNSAPKLPAPDYSSVTEAAKARCLATMGSLNIGSNRPSHDWAYRLHERKQSGEVLELCQLDSLVKFEQMTGKILGNIA